MARKNFPLNFQIPSGFIILETFRQLPESLRGNLDCTLGKKKKKKWNICKIIAFLIAFLLVVVFLFLSSSTELKEVEWVQFHSLHFGLFSCSLPLLPTGLGDLFSSFQIVSYLEERTAMLQPWKNELLTCWLKLTW